jgi:hypothetical protein
MKRLITIAVLAAAAHYGWIFAAPPIKQYFLDAKIREVSEQGRLFNQPEMLNEIMRVIEEKSIPLTAKDVHFRRDGARMTISVKYATTVSMPYYSKTYQFESKHTGIYDPRR